MQTRDYRPLFFGLIFIGIVINYLDRSAIAYAIAPIEQFFHISNTEFGLIGSAFAIVYMLTPPLGGMLVDYFGARLIWGIAAIAWAACCVSLGLAAGFWAFF